jgi:uracil-DNA glycosylase
MHLITLDHETDFDGWRRAARALVLNDIPPSEVTWEVEVTREVIRRMRDAREQQVNAIVPEPHGTFSVPAKFVELAKLAILHRSPERFALLYRLLWRLRLHRDLLMAADDPDVAKASDMAEAVQRDIRNMEAQLRFREIGREQKAHFVAWFAPAHHIVAAAAPFFAAALPTCPGRSSRPTPAHIGTAMR